MNTGQLVRTPGLTLPQLMLSTVQQVRQEPARPARPGARPVRLVRLVQPLMKHLVRSALWLVQLGMLSQVL